MNFSGINYESFADGEGVRVSFFVSGCNRHCPGCFNPEAQHFNYGAPFHMGVLEDVVAHVNLPYIDGLTMLGGEPMESENLHMTLWLSYETKRIGKSVWIYSGYTYEELIARNDNETNAVLDYTDVLVDGAYIESERDTSLPFRGSRNQRIIDVQRSLDAGEVVLYQPRPISN